MDRSLEGIRGIGPARLRALNEAGLYTVRDLARFLPKDYRDLTAPVPLCELRPGEAAAVRVRVAGEVRQHWAKKLLITKVFVTDGEDVVPVVWYNQPWLKDQLAPGRELLLYGKADRPRGALQLVLSLIHI